MLAGLLLRLAHPFRIVVATPANLRLAHPGLDHLAIAARLRLAQLTALTQTRLTA